MKAHRQGIVCLWAFCVHGGNFAKMRNSYNNYRKSSKMHFLKNIALPTIA